ncbi:NAD-binding protein [Cytophagales bacterium LB-30]|uniref:NAD-binding protein n=1 Tax=Shiella aurantiaca TaxID=3058365 RepID=A0ABT8F551_9BACT|nr:ion channel [Shiella aurantiaca]MDN4165384.1 NAD-binding protein [Shiella aurantiaca]
MNQKRPLYQRVLIISILFIAFFWVLINWLLWAESDASNANILSLGDAIWFSVVTLTTVGYGDLYPVTFTGRVIGVSFLIFSLGIYGYLISHISSIITMIKEHDKYGFNGTDFRNHAVIIGWNTFGRGVVDQLIGVNKQVAIVVDDKNQVDLIRELYDKEKVFILYSDLQHFDLIAKTNIKESAMVFVNLNDDTEKLVYLLNIRKHFQKASFIVMLDNANLKQTFINAGVTYAISKNEISSKLLASYMYEPDVATYSEDILSFAHAEEDFDIKQYKVLESNPLIGKTYEEAFYVLKKQHNTILIGLSRQTETGRLLYKNPTEPLTIELADYMIMITNGKSFNHIREIFGTEEGYMA